MAEFKVPKFLENQGVDEIHQRMMENLPSDIDTSEGGHPWNLTMPPAYEKAFLVEYVLTEAIKMIFPRYAEDYPEIMEYHAQSRSLVRKAAEYATGELVITGTAGTVIPANTMFSTIAVNDLPTVDFFTTVEAVIGADGTVTVPIRAMTEGEEGNVAADTIVLNAGGVSGVASVTNPEATTGGVEEESIESLQQRIVDADQTQDIASGGTVAYYKRLALSVNGTGSVVIIRPPDDTTPIQLVVSDAAGQPASEALCKAVYDYIVSPDSPEERKSLINDQIEVVPPDTISLEVVAVIELTASGTIEQAVDQFLSAMKKYIVDEAMNAGEIKWTRVGSVLSSISAINDYKDLTINGGTSNIAISKTEVPSVSEETITFTVGTV